jgi:Zn-dependent M16 (insulinase) family peptidase
MVTNASYHASYYIPPNLTLVIVGNVDHTTLLKTLQEQVEPSILSKGKLDLTNWKRPWVTSPVVPPLKSSQAKVVKFPEEDESIGEFSVTFFGPDVNVPPCPSCPLPASAFGLL